MAFRLGVSETRCGILLLIEKVSDSLSLSLLVTPCVILAQVPVREHVCSLRREHGTCDCAVRGGEGVARQGKYMRRQEEGPVEEHGVPSRGE